MATAGPLQRPQNEKSDPPCVLPLLLIAHSSSSWCKAAARDPHCSLRCRNLHSFRTDVRLMECLAVREQEADEVASLNGRPSRLRASSREYRYSLRG
jgi:hypothetical protein